MNRVFFDLAVLLAFLIAMGGMAVVLWADHRFYRDRLIEARRRGYSEGMSVMAKMIMDRDARDLAGDVDNSPFAAHGKGQGAEARRSHHAA